MKSALRPAWQDLALLVNYIGVIWKVRIICRTVKKTMYWSWQSNWNNFNKIFSVWQQRQILRINPRNRHFQKFDAGIILRRFIDCFSV